MSEWRTYRIADLGRIVTGKTPPSSHPELFDGDIPFITPSDMGYDHRNISTERFVSTDWDSKKRTLLPASAVCVVCIGATIGKICMTSKPSQTNQQVNSVIVDSDLFDPGFVYYGLQTKAGELMARAAGAATPIINKTAFSEVEIDAPPLETQRRIASILGAYDDLIEVNRRQIVVLEEMARGLFTEWFVHFRFPGHEQIAMTETNPNDWRLVKVDSVLRKFRRPMKVMKQEYEQGGTIPCIDQGADFIGGYTNNVDALVTSPLPLCVFGDHTRVLKFITFPFASGADGTQLLYPVDDLTPEFLYFSLLNIDLSNQHYARHFKFLKEQEIWLPTRELIERFTMVVKPQMELVGNIRFQNQKLVSSRDLLIPRLISGELSVTQAERELEEAA